MRTGQVAPAHRLSEWCQPRNAHPSARCRAANVRLSVSDGTLCTALPWCRRRPLPVRLATGPLRVASSPDAACMRLARDHSHDTERTHSRKRRTRGDATLQYLRLRVGPGPSKVTCPGLGSGCLHLTRSHTQLLRGAAALHGRDFSVCG